MERNPERYPIKRLLAGVRHGAPLDLPTLSEYGISAKLAAHYVQAGWLVRLAQGVYGFPGDALQREACVRFLQRRVPGLHVAGKSALGMHGIRHNLSRDVLVLWGTPRYVLPAWFTEHFPARYVCAQLFRPEVMPDGLLAKTLHTPPGQPDGLRVSVPERAVLEMLYEVGTRQGLEEARDLFDGVRSLRPAVLGPLLAGCTSVKTVRLLLTWASETRAVHVGRLLEDYPIPRGSRSRWTGRLNDGTLLTLKPHG